jgi:dihydropteroate synthase
MRLINLKNVQLMGVINLTPDSFSDGGKIINAAQFLCQAEKLLQEGATILDLGAESSGPNSIDVSENQELERILPYLESIKKLRSKYDFKLSVDTCKASVAKAALEFGADIINDITGLRYDHSMAQVLQASDCQIILMYSKDPTPRTSKTATTYNDVIKTIIEFFEERIQFCKNNNIATSRIILDPGMGAFISTIPDYSYEIIERLSELKDHFKLPILVGTSLKSMHPFPLEERLIPSVTTSTLAALNGADILRVHQVKEHYQAIKTLSF